MRWAYPRSHGATRMKMPSGRTSKGLSPLARGNPLARQRFCRQMGPIPARTGQPSLEETIRKTLRAYPRSHGATLKPSQICAVLPGLSPLARGNRADPGGAGQPVGPIPARTGQPPANFGDPFEGGAYPRSHGATVLKSKYMKTLKGLSPLARGNRPADALTVPLSRPIPARTGQPAGGHRKGNDVGAYPRSHGATKAG